MCKTTFSGMFCLVDFFNLSPHFNFTNKKFYWFCTGCLSLPVGGLGINRITVKFSSLALLPAAATCFRLLKFYLRPNLAANRGALDISLKCTSGYFFIENGVQNGVVGEAADRMTRVLADSSNTAETEINQSAQRSSEAMENETNESGSGEIEAEPSAESMEAMDA